METEQRKVNPNCANASNPFHVCADYCAQRVHSSKPQSLLPKLVVAAHTGEGHKDCRGIVAMERDVSSSCRNASNPYHQCAEYCSTKNPVVKGQLEEKRSVSVENGGKMENNHKKTEAEHISGVDMVQNGEGHKENQRIVVSERNVDPLCKNASNPYHQCAEYCCSGKPGVKRENREKRSVDSGTKMEFSKNLDPKSASTSNPYHVCAEHYSQKRNKIDHVDGGKSVVTAHHETKGGLKTAVTERIHPNCVNASNPYHKCTSYCLQKINQSK